MCCMMIHTCLSAGYVIALQSGRVRVMSSGLACLVCLVGLLTFAILPMTSDVLILCGPVSRVEFGLEVCASPREWLMCVQVTSRSPA